MYTPAGGPPQGPRPSPRILDAIGVDGVFALLADLYAELEQSPVRALFPEDMRAASERSAAFFVQLLGGPPLYVERHGPPRMRQRHLPFEIDERARGVWLACFDTVLRRHVDERRFPEAELEGFRGFLRAFSAWMVNVAPGDTGSGEPADRG